MKPLPSALCLAACVLAARPAVADSYRLRADAFAAAAPPVGMLVLQGAAKQPPWLDAEALVWLGAGERSGDVLVLTAALRDPQGRGALRFGRMLLSTGAVRPIHMDGAVVRAQMRSGPGIEVFGGMPVEPGFGSRSFDWLIGQRFSVRSDERWTAGLSYLHRRDEGRVAFEEVGLDGFVLPAPWLSATVIAAMDTARGDVTQARSAVAAHGSIGKLELFASHRSPSLLLPATSLFAALGDQPSTDVGLSGWWRAAPRLDVSATASFESIGGSFAAEQTVRATLRLDDRGEGSLGLELRRQSAADSSWTGARTTARMPLPYRLAASAEIEVAVPDHDGPRGPVWPWALVALAYRPHGLWEVAGALEAGASPSAVASFTALLRLSAGWDTRP